MTDRQTELWFSLGMGGRLSDSESTARAWQPGDGTRCALASIQRREPCGPPVAVVETSEFRYGKCHDGTVGYAPECGIRRTTARVTCAEHLAEKVGRRLRAGRSESITTAERKAAEETVAKHWGEYQELYRRHLENERAELLSHIPEPLRALILAAVESEGGAA